MKLGTLVRIPDMNRLDEVFQPLNDLHFTSCQLAYKPPVFLREEAEAIRAAADRHGIEISAHFIGHRDPFTIYDLRHGYCVNGISAPMFRAQRMEYLMQGISFVRWLGIQDMIIHAGFISNNPFDSEYPSLVALIRLLGMHAKEQGIHLLFETGAESAVALLRLIEDADTGNLYVNLDTGNAIMYGYANPVDALYTYGQYVRNIHVKDGLPPTRGDTLGPEKPLGEGVVDFPRFMRKLRALGYDRFLTIEREISGDQQRTDIAKARDYLMTLLDENGWKVC
ncbi:MAG: sugar phosphate isomerase/epimerase family protein [Clostridia bacterium]